MSVPTPKPTETAKPTESTNTDDPPSMLSDPLITNASRLNKSKYYEMHLNIYCDCII